MKLRWSPQSLEDRKQIYAFIFEQDQDAAEYMDALLDKQAHRLLLFPESGKRGRVSGTREWVVHRHYILVYTHSPDTIGILAVLHTSRQYPA